MTLKTISGDTKEKKTFFNDPKVIWTKYGGFKSMKTTTKELKDLQNPRLLKPRLYSFDEVRELLSQRDKEIRAEGYTHGFNNGYREKTKEMPKAYQKGREDIKKELKEKIK